MNGGTPRIAPASLWTRPKVQEFIQHVKTDPSSVLVVGRGETMTVRVPTHEGGEEKFLGGGGHTIHGYPALIMSSLVSILKCLYVTLGVVRVGWG